MINRTTLTTLVNQSILTKNAALTEEAKAALLTFKKNFLQTLKSGDLLEGILFKQNGENILLEIKTGIQLSAILLENFPENLPENTKLQFIVKSVKDEKIQLVFKQPEVLEETLLTDKVTKVLNLPQNQEMKKVIDIFTQFELPLDRKLLMQTYHHVQTTKLPEQVLVNILKGLELNFEEVFKGLESFKAMPLQKAITDLLEGCLDTVKENKQMASHFIRTLTPFISDKGVFEVEFNGLNLDGLEEVFSEQPLAIEKFIKLFSQSLSTFTQENLKEGHLKEQLMFKDSECLKELVKAVKTFPKLLEVVHDQVAEIEIQQPIWQKLNEQGHYFTFPWMTHLGEAKGEVYFYKPKKHKKNKERDFYTVIALDMPYLKHIEAHIHEISSALDITLYTAESHVSDMINSQLVKLTHLLKDKGYTVCKCSCQIVLPSDTLKPFIKQTDECIKGIDFKI